MKLLVTGFLLTQGLFSVCLYVCMCEREKLGLLQMFICWLLFYLYKYNTILEFSHVKGIYYIYRHH